ncbi:putative transcriptional regulator, TetR family [Candidatus Protochlamydia naegleriophila]|uniref:Putative transcriptional regulator, TetR family n=1 Tax=Candidatus Protochlamydia naegleriophila TaxID=389348 RepID=A0A0U5K790_9BACT|nr:TetR/AcrR family transcriptional regulator [Candidatus Protochlamydia naegleriophila]CUI18043.1 putative transcriptional regulator, TetR family [Candidatus Protochlamydia naegleriophila]
MSNQKKRAYRSEGRLEQAIKTRGRILTAAKHLFESDGFECVTIEKLAHAADVSAPTIYALFQSKRGVLRALLDEVLPVEQFEALVNQAKAERSPQQRLMISAKIARHIYDAEKAQIDLLHSASMLAPEFKELEKEREMRRYTRQEETIKQMISENSLQKGLTLSKARDILWAFTGRDLYRMLVIEQAWTSDDYEQWLGQLLIKALVGNAL